MRYLALLSLVVGCQLPNPRLTGVPELPPLPAVMPTMLGPIPVVWADSLPSAEPGYITMGRFNPLDRQIEMWRRIAGRAEQWRVLIHESCHVWHWDSGVRYVNDDIERVCDAWARERVQAMLARR